MLLFFVRHGDPTYDPDELTLADLEAAVCDRQRLPMLKGLAIHIRITEGNMIQTDSQKLLLVEIKSGFLISISCRVKASACHVFISGLLCYLIIISNTALCCKGKASERRHTFKKSVILYNRVEQNINGRVKHNKGE